MRTHRTASSASPLPVLRAWLVVACTLAAGAGVAAADEPSPRATLLHVPVASATPGHAIELVAVVDGAWAEPALVARFRPMAGGDWREATFDLSSAGGWYATIPADVVIAPGAEYYIVGRGPAGETHHFASAEAPQPIRIDPSVVERLAELDHLRTGGRTDTVSLDVGGHDFGNRYGGADRFLRAELRWTHRISRRLHSIGFGFGLIQGRTPDGEGVDARDAVTAARYGAAEVRLRLHPSLFVDARLMLGVSHLGFLRGLGGAITFGKPWRSNVSVAGEILDDLGPTARVRLQWDTVPPLLMGASIVRTDLPGAILEASGLYLEYDLSYRLSSALGLRASASYGSRDGAGRFGGGLGLSTSF